jgi:hypothetical protein
MYPYQIKLDVAKGLSMYIDDVHIETGEIGKRAADSYEYEHGVETTVKLESYAGSGSLEITFAARGRKAMVMMSPDEALVLADTLALYANASKRIAERDKPNIVLRRNNCVTNDPCEVCGGARRGLQVAFDTVQCQ